MPYKRYYPKKKKTVKSVTRAFSALELCSRMRSKYMAHFVNVARPVPAVSQFFVLKLPIDQVSSSVSGVVGQQYGTNKLYGTTDWNALSTIYDAFRCVAMCVEFFPATQASGILVYAPLPVYYDPDSNAAVSSVNAALEYESTKVWDLTKQQKYTYKIPKFNQLSADGITGGYSVQGIDGFFDLAPITSTSAGYNFGIVAWYGTGFGISSIYGNVVVSFLLEFKFRR